ncbi:tyrosine-type recombinase/integrase [Maridesulfovibrio hydrothermalis]|uniref:Integrase family protein n=1 Tax=Maridesulfovibrio hydrothermalis AM13 = DSM 14728 TaxID=1121451 RepID=L0RB47_9BACT|nr:integrase arm-type DNA-binding domain-containing protein [Maridesulfovibrio hydrothermalis]CCO24003.1 Integrase family protein [Maridesulfovibrio hydrothermalis AM13 = DSM 14728]
MLTEKEIKALKGLEKNKKYFDAHGLYIEVTPKSRKYWRYKYRFKKKEKRISLGVYPQISLKEARLKRNDAAAILAEGKDPALFFSKGRKAEVVSSEHNTFYTVSREWFQKNETRWSASHAKDVKARLEKNVYPFIGDIPVEEIQPIDVLNALRKVEARGSHEVAHRTLGICGMVFRYAVAACMVKSDPCRDLKGALTPPKKGNYAAITDHKEIGALMRSIFGYNHTKLIKCATLFSAYTFCRQKEIRNAKWSEIDFKEAIWVIPGEKMKMKLDHIVPLSRQCLEILEQMAPISKHCSEFIFPSIRTNSRPISDGSVNIALRSMGYSKEQMTAHGFRAMASTRLYEMNRYRGEVIERQLAHTERNKVKAAYNRAEYFEERKAMMQEWADYLDAAAKEF